MLISSSSSLIKLAPCCKRAILDWMRLSNVAIGSKLYPLKLMALSRVPSSL